MKFAKSVTQLFFINHKASSFHKDYNTFGMIANWILVLLTLYGAAFLLIELLRLMFWVIEKLGADDVDD